VGDVLRTQNRAIDGGVRLLDLACITVAMPAAYVVRDRLTTSTRGVMYPLAQYWPALALALLLWLAFSWLFRVYETFRTQRLLTELYRLTQALGMVALATAATVFLVRGQQDVSRLSLGLFFGFALALLCGRTGCSPARWPGRPAAGG
jgi:hypothetical protein